MVQATWARSASVFALRHRLAHRSWPLLFGWRARNPIVILTVAELSDRDLVAEVEGRHLDVVLTASQALWPRVASVPLFRDRLMAVLPAAARLRSGPWCAGQGTAARFGVLGRVARTKRKVWGSSCTKAVILAPA